MKILSPISSTDETLPLIEAGADELYCGVLPDDWHRKYGNVASVNRAESARSSLLSFEALEDVVRTAHDRGVRVFLAMNGLYTGDQYPMLERQIAEAETIGIDAFIVADLGFLLKLLDFGVKAEIHISTGGTTFNPETARFFASLGASRIVIPRQLQLREMQPILDALGPVESEVLVLNAGCRNIDGFCTLRHGIAEARHSKLWGASETAKLGHMTLNVLRRMPRRAVNFVNSKLDLFGAIAPCLKDFDITVEQVSGQADAAADAMKARLKPNFFDYFYSLDTCGACALYDFVRMGVTSVKIVGRGYATAKKVKDVAFLRAALQSLADHALGRPAFEQRVRARSKATYGVDCRDLCYYARDSEE